MRQRRILNSVTMKRETMDAGVSLVLRRWQFAVPKSTAFASAPVAKTPVASSWHELVDTHCHLNHIKIRDKVQGGLQGALMRAAEQRVTQMITIGCDLPERDELFDLCTKHPNRLFCSVGIHPHCSDGAHAAVLSSSQITRHLLDSAALAPPGALVAFGECGLDFYKSRADEAAQLRVFLAHLEACTVADLPVVIHSRSADNAMIAALRGFTRQGKQLRGVLHCFDGGERLAREGMELGMYISCSGILTFRQRPDSDLRRVFHSIVPDDRLLVETDAPFLAPIPHRGAMNEPSFVVHTAQALADLRCVSVAHIAAVTTTNARRLFKLPPPA